jgi:zinc protease
MAGFTSQKMPLRLIVIAAVFVSLLVLLGLGFAFLDKKSNADDASNALPQKVFNASYDKLENGLEIIVVPNHRSPVVTHMVWYKVGAADETPGQSGIAHFLEHLMFKGSNGLAPGEFSETIRALGGNDNAFTTQDATAYFQSASKEHLHKLMQMESGRMRGMTPPEGEVLSEQKVIIEERKQRTDNHTPARLFEQMRAIAHINHPYAIPVIGWMQEIENLKWPEIKGFYDRWYGPNNAVLVVTGDVTPEEVREIAAKTYGTIPRINVPQRNRPEVPALMANPVLSHKDASIHQASVNLLFKAPSAHQDIQTSLALQVLEEIMGSGSSSRLYESLVVEQKLATSVSLSYNPWSLDQSEIWISAYPVEGITPEQLTDAIRAELDKMIESGVGEDELKTAQQRLQDSTYFALDSLSGPAMIIGNAVTSGVKLDDIETWPHLIGAVKAEEIRNAAALYLNMSGREPSTSYVQGILLPEIVEDKTALPPVTESGAINVAPPAEEKTPDAEESL